MYYDDVLFRNKVLHKIFNPTKQLYLNLSENNKITDVSLLGNVHTLKLSFCEKITDVSALGNVHTLELMYCKNINDFSALINVHTLNLCGCEITDVSVSVLGNVHT
jgi:Leucine-rich repeat (LRR) protein